jgi:hypothetical protein
MPRRIVVVLAAILVVLILLSASLKVYYVRSTTAGTLLWNKDEAYIFQGVAQQGYRLSYFGLLIELVKEFVPFGGSAPDDRHCSVLVLRVTSDAIERYIADNLCAPGECNPLGQSIYTVDNSNPGVLLKWSGTQFEPATSEEGKAFRSAYLGGKIPLGPTYDNVSGWSKRAVGGQVLNDSPKHYSEIPAKASLSLDGHPLTFVMNSGFINHQPYIDLYRGDGPPDRIWSLDGRSHRVTKAEYQKIFGSRSKDVRP